MSKELLELMKRVDTRNYSKSPPKKILDDILHEIEVKQHYGTYRNWETMVELLANWILEHEDLTLGSMSCQPFKGLKLEDKDLYNHINDLDLFKHYVTALKNDPWDYIGEVYTERELVGKGENLTPRGIVEMTLKMTYDNRVANGEAELFAYDSYLRYLTWYASTYHVLPSHIKSMKPPIHTQLDRIGVTTPIAQNLVSAQADS